MLFFYYSTGDLGDRAVRYQEGFLLTESAEGGTVGMSTVEVDDPTGALNLVGLKPFKVDETDCSWRRVFTGYFADRSIVRGPSMLTAAARRWKCSVVDANAVLNFEVIRGSTANRPAETDIQRITWWLSSGYQGPIFDTGFFQTSGPKDLDACDYRGRYGADLMSDCATASGKNYFVAWDAATNKLALHYYAPLSTLNSCTIKISNVRADMDETTVFAPSSDADLFRDPSRVYSGVYLQYGDGSASVYESDPAVGVAYNPRDLAMTDPSVNTAAGASRKALQMLADAATEFDKITVTLHKVSAALVNLIRAGQRIQVKFTHMPGYEAYVYIRINRRQIRQESQGLYSLSLELSNTKIIGGTGGGGTEHPPAPIDRPATLVTGGVLTTADFEVKHQEDVLDTYPATPFVAGAPKLESAVTQNTGYASCGCPLAGLAGWGPGTTLKQQWVRFTPTFSAADIGVEFTIPIPVYPLDPPALRGVAAFESVVVGINKAGVANHGRDYVPFTLIALAAGGKVVIPRSMLTPGVYNWLVIDPAWRAIENTFICGDLLIDVANGPAYGGEFISGRSLATPTVTATYKSIVGPGITPWVSPQEEANGTRLVFTLYGWDGTGTPLVTINGLSVPETDYVASGTTVTFYDPPPADCVLMFKYRMG